MSQSLQPSLPQGSKKTVPLAMPANGSELETFWRSFTVFLTPFEKFCVRRWYILGLVYFAVFFVTAFFTDIAFGIQYYHDMWYIYNNGNFQYSDLYSVFFANGRGVFCALIAGMFLTLGLAHRWQASIPQFFQTLEQRYHLSDEKDYQAYLAAYQRGLLYGKGRALTRIIIISAVMLISLIVYIILIGRNDIHVLTLDYGYFKNTIIVLMQGIYRFSIDCFYPLLLIYLAISFVWIFGATGMYVRRFVRHFPLHIQLAHPDRCGGFKFLGDFVLNMALVILAGATVLALFTVWRGYSIWSFATGTLTLFLIIISYLAFFAPLSAIHQSMLRERRGYEDAIAYRAEKIEVQINEAIKDGDVSRMKAAKEEFEVVRALYPDAVGFPTWPFNWRMLVTFFSSQIIPALSLVVGISPVASDFFTRLFSFLSGH